MIVFEKSGDVSDYCSLFSQTFYGLLFSYLTITDVTSYVHNKFLVYLLLYIATEKPCQISQNITVNSSMSAPISEPCVPMLLVVIFPFYFIG